jgi:hypothetical protein
MKNVLELIGAIAMMALSNEVDGFYVAFEGGDPILENEGHRFELSNIGVFNSREEEVRALIVIGGRIYAETNSNKTIIAYDNGITQSFKLWAKGEI